MTFTFTGELDLTASTHPTLRASGYPVVLHCTTDGTLSIDAGGNTIFGQYRSDSDTLHITDLSSTLMMCHPDVMRREDDLKTLFSGAIPITHRANQLTCWPGDHTKQLVFVTPPTQLRDFTGAIQPWRSTHPAFTHQLAQDVTVTITADTTTTGHLTGHTGCNQFFGDLTVTNQQLNVNLGFTRKGCEPARQALETALAEFCTTPQPFTYLGTRLTIGAPEQTICLQTTKTTTQTQRTYHPPRNHLKN